MRLRPELFGQAAADGLSSDHLTAHLEALAWLYAHERDDCVIPSRLMRAAIVVTQDPADATAALARAGYWAVRDDGSVEVLDHANVVRGSLHATRMKRAKDQRAQARARSRASTDDASTDTTAATTAEVSADSTGESAPRLPTYLTTEHHEDSAGVTGPSWPPVRAAPDPGSHPEQDRPPDRWRVSGRVAP